MTSELSGRQVRVAHHPQVGAEFVMPVDTTIPPRDLTKNTQSDIRNGTADREIAALDTGPNAATVRAERRHPTSHTVDPSFAPAPDAVPAMAP